MIPKIKYEYLLVFIALIFSLIVNYCMQISYVRFIFSDSYSYILAAKELYYDFRFNDHRPLVINAINGLPLLFGYDEKSLFVWSLLVNYFCWIGTILLLYKIAKNKFSERKSFLFALIYIFFIGNFFIVFHLLSETIFTFLLVVVLQFLILFNTTKKIGFFIFSLSLLIVMSMIKPLCIGLIFILLLIYFKDLKLVFSSKYSFLILISSCVLLLQLIKMNKEYGNYTISYIDVITYYNYLGTRADCLKNNIEFEQGKNERVVKLRDTSMKAMKLIAKKDFEEQLINNKCNLFKAFFINIINNTSKGSDSVHACKNIKKTNYFDVFSYVFKATSKIQNIIFTIIGFVLSVYFIFSKTSKLIKFISLLIVYFILISAISSNQGDRFHIVIFPVILILVIIGNFDKATNDLKKIFLN